MKKTAIFTEKMGTDRMGISALPGASLATYSSPAVKAGNLVFVGGTVSVDSQGELVGKGDVEAQARQVYENIKALLEAAGGSLDDVVMQRTYLTNMEDMAKVWKVRERYFRRPLPAATSVEVSNLYKDFLIEVEAVAMVG